VNLQHVRGGADEAVEIYAQMESAEMVSRRMELPHCFQIVPIASADKFAERLVHLLRTLMDDPTRIQYGAKPLGGEWEPGRAI